MGTRARLILTLRVVFSMLSSSFCGNRALMRLKRGRKSTKIDPRKYLVYTMGNASSGVVNTVMVVARDKATIIQYPVALVEKS